MKLKDYLDSAGVHYDLVEHPYAVTSMHIADEANVSGEDMVKAVVLNDGDNYVLAVVPATHRVQLGKMRKDFNCYMSLASEQDICDLFGDCDLGAVPPIGHAYGVDVIVDNSLYDRDDVYFEAGDHTDLVHVTGREFMDLLGSVRHGEISRHI
ncbi:MAG: aminoacyl-tRNA deacylase [Gammaproteobacteria bacterium]